MPQENENTVSFTKQRENENRVDSILRTVYRALEEKGYKPINQLVGYMISGDPAYITSHNEARNLICKVDRDELMEILIKNYLKV